MPAVALLEQLQDFEIVTLDHQVLRRVPVHAVFRAGAQRTGGWREGKLTRAALAVPVEAILLLPFIHGSAKKLLEHLEVHLALR